MRTTIILLIIGLLFTSPVQAEKQYVQVEELMAHFHELTALQREKWNKENAGRYWVMGMGAIDSVKESDMFSRMDGYEIAVKLVSGNKAVLYYPKTKENYNRVINLSKGQEISFRGNLKEMEDWAFWVSAYIKGE